MCAATKVCVGAAPPTEGAAVKLSNLDSGHPVFYQNVGNPAAGADVFVEILGGPDANSLEPIASRGAGAPTIFNIGTGMQQPGFFDAGYGIVPGVADNAPATFQVLIWKDAASFETATERIASGLLTQNTGFAHPPGLPQPAPLEFPASLVIPAIPEPSVVVLSLIGLLVITSSIWQKWSGSPGRPTRENIPLVISDPCA